MNEKKKAVRFFCLTLVVLLVCSVFIWGFQTNWGNVNIDRIYINGPDGTQISSLIYIPENATDETPAPVVVIYHGRSNHAHSNDTWSMELARRGYVVLSPDLQGGGESDVTIDRNVQSIYVAEYANNLSFVQKDQLNLIGYSAGTATVIATYHAMPETVHSICNVFGPFMVQLHGGLEGVNTNYCLIKSTADQYDGDFIGDPQDCLEFMREQTGVADLEPGVDVTDWRGEYLLRYSQIDGTLHQTGNISGTTINAILDYESAVNEEPVAMEGTVRVWQQIFSGIACVAMMFLLAASVNLLMQLDFFASAANPVPVKAPRKGAKAWIIDFLFALVIPAVLFIPVSYLGMSAFRESKILTSVNLNGIMLWLLVAMCLIGLIRLAVRTSRRKAAGEVIAASDFCLAPAGGKFYWPNVGKALLIAMACVIFFGVWMAAVEGFMGINYQVWNLSTYLRPSPARIVKAIPYIIIIFIVMFSGNISQRVLPSTGNERKDMWIAVTVNTVLTASALFVLLVIQYGGNFILGTGQAVFEQWPEIPGVGTCVGALDFAFGYCYMMGGTTGVVTYLYRKHGNVLCGVIPASIFCGLFTLLSFTLVR